MQTARPPKRTVSTNQEVTWSIARHDIQRMDRLKVPVTRRRAPTAMVKATQIQGSILDTQRAPSDRADVYHAFPPGQLRPCLSQTQSTEHATHSQSWVVLTQLIVLHVSQTGVSRESMST